MIYLIFCLTTSITAIINLMQPVLERLRKSQPTNNLVENKFLTYFVFLIMGILVAPFLILPAIIPHLTETFQDTLYESIKD